MRSHWTLPGAREGSRPPGPRGGGLGGNLAAYENDRLGFLVRARDEHGGVVRFGPRTSIVNDPLLVAGVLRTREDFGVPENFLQQRIVGPGSGHAEGLRAALSPGLRPGGLVGAPAVVERHLAPALDRLADGWHVPVTILEPAMAGAVAELYFGSDGRLLATLLRDLLDDLSRVIGNPFALPERWHTPVRRRISARHERLREQVALLLAARCERVRSEPADLASGIVERVSGRFPLEEVADLVIGSLLAAQRVPAAAASWLLMALADHSDLQEQVGSDPQVAGRVVAEVLRLFPPTWLIVRTAARPVEVGGYAFAPGHHFLISPYVVHRDPDAYPEPTVFAPDRWRKPMALPAAYLPFGAGIHVCPGRHLATILLTELAVRVAAGHQVVRRPGPVVPDPRTTLLPSGLVVTLRPRGDRRRQVPGGASVSR